MNDIKQLQQSKRPRKSPEKRPATVTLFFTTHQACVDACSMLGLSPRKVTDVDRKHTGGYSNATGHWASIVKGQAVRRVPITSKLIIDAELFDVLDETTRGALGACDVTSVGWIVG